MTTDQKTQTPDLAALAAEARQILEQHREGVDQARSRGPTTLTDVAAVALERLAWRIAQCAPKAG